MADGGRVRAGLRISGTPRGACEDLGVPATSQPAEWQAVINSRVAGGQSVENWVIAD